MWVEGEGGREERGVWGGGRTRVAALEGHDVDARLERGAHLRARRGGGAFAVGRGGMRAAFPLPACGRKQERHEPSAPGRTSLGVRATYSRLGTARPCTWPPM